MKKIFVVFMFFLFTMSGCQAATMYHANELQKKLDAFQENHNQFSFELNTHMQVTYDKMTTTDKQTFQGRFQPDIEYFEMTSGDITTVEQVKGNELYRYSIHKNDMVNGVQFYTLEKVFYNEDEAYVSPMVETKIDIRGIQITNEDGIYVIKGKVPDFLPKETYEEIKTLYEEADLDIRVLEKSPITIEIEFQDESMNQKMTMELDMDDISLTISVDLHIVYATFSIIDFSNTNKYIQSNSREPLEISLNKPIYYKSQNPGKGVYTAYFEVGKYAVQSNVFGVSNMIEYDIYDGNNLNSLRVLNNSDNHLRRLFEVKKAGYYTFEMNYDIANFTYETRIRKLYYETDGFEEISYSISESTSINYVIEHEYDIISIELKTSERTMILFDNNQLVDYRFASQGSFEKYFYLHNATRTVYMYRPLGAVQGLLNIKYVALDAHGRTYNDPQMKTMNDQFSLPIVPEEAHMMKIVVNETQTFKVEFDIWLGYKDWIVYDIVYGTTNAKVSIYNDQVTLTPGTYYFKPNLDDQLVYRVRMVPIN